MEEVDMWEEPVEVVAEVANQPQHPVPGIQEVTALRLESVDWEAQEMPEAAMEEEVLMMTELLIAATE
jgi:hypothetical protein